MYFWGGDPRRLWQDLGVSVNKPEYERPEREARRADYAPDWRARERPKKKGEKARRDERARLAAKARERRNNHD